MESIVSILPNLSTDVISVLSLVYVVLQFLKQLKDMRREHETIMNERESSFRNLEKEVRTQILDQLSKNTSAMERVISHLDRR